MEFILDNIRSLTQYQQLLKQLQTDVSLPGLGLPRAARLPVLAALNQDFSGPILLVTDRADHSLVTLPQERREDVLAHRFPPEVIAAVAAGVVRCVEIHPVHLPPPVYPVPPSSRRLHPQTQTPLQPPVLHAAGGGDIDQ